jgi:cytochrome c556
MKRRSLHAALGTLVLGLVCAVPASAQVRPEVLVQQRQAAMILQGKYFYGHLRPAAQGKIPYDAERIARYVGYLDALAQMPWDGFAPATKGLKTGATAAVYAEPAKFKQAQDQFVAEVRKLSEITRTGEEAAIRAQILAVNKSCASCHDAFRERR